MATIITKSEIIELLKNIDVIDAMQKGFIDYSNGKCIVPPVGELLIEENNGEAHIKYGYIKGGDYYVVKIASGFYNNHQLGLPSSQGVMLVFNQKTGVTKGVLLDEGHLTDVRTAAAGALVAHYFAPKQVKAIGIVGSGIQAKLQLEYLQKVRPCTDVFVWNRNPKGAEAFQEYFKNDFNVRTTSSPSELAKHCNLIVTTTPSKTPLLVAADILPGTHITAMGSDTPEKQEIDGNVLAKSDIVISDSLPQSKTRGEVFRAVQAGNINKNQVIELGRALQNNALQRSSDNQITIADLTGVAVQDIMIAQAVFENKITKHT